MIILVEVPRNWNLERIILVDLTGNKNLTKGYCQDDEIRGAWQKKSGKGNFARGTRHFTNSSQRITSTILHNAIHIFAVCYSSRDQLADLQILHMA